MQEKMNGAVILIVCVSIALIAGLIFKFFTDGVLVGGIGLIIKAVIWIISSIGFLATHKHARPVWAVALLVSVYWAFQPLTNGAARNPYEPTTIFDRWLLFNSFWVTGKVILPIILWILADWIFAQKVPQRKGDGRALAHNLTLVGIVLVLAIGLLFFGVNQLGVGRAY